MKKSHVVATGLSASAVSTRVWFVGQGSWSGMFCIFSVYLVHMTSRSALSQSIFFMLI